MTHATFFKSSSDGEILGFNVSGHAGFADSGEDIVCASISALVINTINSIEQFTDAEFEGSANEDNAEIDFRIVKLLNDKNEVRVLLKSLELGLSQISMGNPEYLSVNFKEV